MKIGFVGAGKVGCSLGRYFAQKHKLIGFASKTYASAEKAARLTGSQAFESPIILAAKCDALFITTPDGQIVPTWEAIKDSDDNEVLNGMLICHCSGALPSSELSGCSEKGAYAYSIHPLFAIPSKSTSTEELKKAFFAIEGDSRKLDEAISIVEAMENPYQIIETEQKVRYHAAAAMASNHVIALYRLSCDELVKCGFSPESAEKALAPLFLGNARHVASEGTAASLTGPAERGDMATIEKHLSCLSGKTREVYQILNETLLRIAEEKHRTAN